ncbi:cation:proton antiporter [Candidatus Latescibacterota bacterium]
MDPHASAAASTLSHHLPDVLAIGLFTLVSFYVGRLVRRVRMPSIIGYLMVGLVIGPSVLDVVTEGMQHELAFITDLALGFVAFSIGLELSLQSLRSLGGGIIAVIVIESFAAGIAVAIGVYLLTGDVAVALIFGSLAPASAPAGTVAVIREYEAAGTLTKALYAVVGFDDGLAIIIFGFAFAVVQTLLAAGTEGAQIGVLQGMWQPLREIGLSVLLGWVLAMLMGLLTRRFNKGHNVFIHLVAIVLIANGLSALLHLSLMLTNLTVGLVLVNRRHRGVIENLHLQLSTIMPLFFILFFTLAGAHLQVAALPELGALGVVYILCRTAGKLVGARLGAEVGRLEDKVKRYVGPGILAQAGVAIGLSLIVQHELRGLGRIVEVGGESLPMGTVLGAAVITTITATSIVFEIIGPIMTRWALGKAGEIGKASAPR